MASSRFPSRRWTSAKLRSAAAFRPSPAADFADLFKILGDIKFYRGDLESAERYYRTSLSLNNEYSEASLSLALTLRNEGRAAEADEMLGRLIEHDPENVLARNLLGRGPFDAAGG